MQTESQQYHPVSASSLSKLDDELDFIFIVIAIPFNSYLSAFHWIKKHQGK